MTSYNQNMEEEQREESFYKSLFKELFSPEIRNLAVIIVVLLIVGMLYYNQVEDWGWVDSLYFSITTLTTVGYGDLSPTSDGSKLFTTAYIFIGLGVVLTFLQTIARQQAKEPLFKKIISHHTRTNNDKSN